MLCLRSLQHDQLRTLEEQKQFPRRYLVTSAGSVLSSLLGEEWPDSVGRSRSICSRQGSVIQVVVQLGEHSLAALVREDSLLLGEEGHLFGHFAYNVLIYFIATGLHLNSDAHFQVLILQGQEGDKIINEVPVNEAAVPEATWETDKKEPLDIHLSIGHSVQWGPPRLGEGDTGACWRPVYQHCPVRQGDIKGHLWAREMAQQ